MIRRLTHFTIAACFLAAASSPAVADSAAEAARYYEDGLARYDRGEMPAAIIQLKNALQQDGKMLAAHVLLAKALMREREYAAAEVAFREALRLGVNASEVAVPFSHLLLGLGRPKELLERFNEEGMPLDVAVEVMSLRAIALADTGALEQSLATLDHAAEMAPASSEPSRTAASILLGAGRMEEARAAAERAVELEPRKAGAWNAKASIEHAAGNLTQALEDYGRALEIDPQLNDARIARAGLLLDLKREAEARRDLEWMAARDDQDPRAEYLRAQLHGRAGDSASAANSLRIVKAQVDELPSEWAAGNEQYLMLGALANHALGNREAAKEYLETLLKRFTRNFGARKLLTSILIEMGESARALTTLDPVLRAAPRDPGALYLAGRAHLERKSYTRALRYLTRAAESGATPEIERAIAATRIGSGKARDGLASLEKVLAERPDDLGAGFMLATLYMRDGKHDQALAIMEGLAKRQPDNPAVINMHGAIRFASGDRIAARKAFDRAIQLAPDFLAPHLNLARIDRAEGKLDHSMASLEALRERFKGNPDVHYEIGLLDQSRGRFGDAILSVRKALDLDRSNGRFALLLIDLHLSMRQTGEALEVAKAVAIERPGDLTILEALGRTHLAYGDRKGALQAYQDMTKLAEFDAAMQLRIGRLNLAAGDLRAAEYNVNKALTAAPEDLAARVFHAEILLAKGDLERLEKIARELRAKRESRAIGIRIEAEIALARGDLKRAAKLASDVLRANPNSANVQALARIHLASGKPRKAESTAAAWLAKHRDDSVVRMMLSEMQMARADWKRARGNLEVLRKSSPASPAVHNNLALAMLELGDAGALDAAREAVRLAPESGLALDTLGWVLARRGHLEEGLRHLRDARLRLPNNPEVRWHLAYVLERLGKARDAKRELDAALARGDAFMGIEEARLLRRKL